VLQQQFGAARELDVLLDETIGSMPDELRARDGMREFIKAAEASRVASHRRARAALVSTHCSELLAQLGPAVGRYAWQRAHGSAAGKRTTQSMTDLAAEVMRSRHPNGRKQGEKFGTSALTTSMSYLSGSRNCAAQPIFFGDLR
jgi:phage-related tail fiber protein